jgi:hypothetical protein
MVLSWIVGRRRVATGERPGWLAAWGLVGLDFAAIALVLALIWLPVMTFIYATQPGDGMTILILFVVYFFPLQLVLITSSIWASKSRWDDTPGKGPGKGDDA